MICFSGNRNGIDDATGLENCAKGIEPILKNSTKIRCNYLYGSI